MYLVNGWIKLIDQDDYEKGCIGQTTMFDGRDTFESDDLNALIDKLKEFSGHDDILLNSCDEIGRIDIQGLEDTYSCPPTNSEIEQWKKGEKILYAVTYTFYVYKCEPISLLGE